MSDPSHNLKKTFSIKGNSLQIQIQSTAPYQTSIPITLDPFGRSLPGWSRSLQRPVWSTNAWSWKQDDPESIEITASQAELTARSFLDSLSFMDQPEIPDRPYPPGHYTPIPLAVIDLKSEANPEITIRIISP
jgi:hypothetical protein